MRAALTAIMLTLAVPLCADEYLGAAVISHPTVDRFSVCFNHSCETVVTQALSRDEWQRVTALLQPAAPTAAAERRAIGHALALMEQIVGNHTGTRGDKGGNLRGFGAPGQLDCIDESTNTSTYLYLLESAGLLQYHTLQARVTRFGLFVGMPHTTAVIRETASGQRYAVDTWFFDNGEPPPIIELSAWKSGWDPAEAEP
jgi:hypothetical protein